MSPAPRHPSFRRCGLALALAALPLGCGPRPARVQVKFVIYDNDNSFAATVFAQEVNTGQTFKFAYGPHTPYIVAELKQPGTYVFYATLVEAPDDYHYGFTGYQAAAYGHMTRGGTRDSSVNLIALDLKPGGTYKAFISDHWAELPKPNQPVTVPWHREQQS
jgi:hypothetical protein